jgi:anaerobic magnesium-protoporphyrin IX monomethyl ester cyclase
MSDIVLIYPYVYKHARNSMLFHPLGIAQLSALLRQRGMDTSIIDLTFRNTDEALIEICEIKPKVVGIYVMLTMIDNALDLARKIRVISPETLLVCGGPMPTLRPEQFDRDFNLIFRGESILSFPLFCKDFLDAGDISDVITHHERYPGIYMRDMQTNKVIKTPEKATDEALINQLPIPDRSDFDHDNYKKFWLEKDGIAQASIMSTYGCPHKCDFCAKPVFGTNFRKRSIDSIIEEIHDIKSFGYESLWIADDCFTLDLNHVRALCERMIKDDLQMKWTCLSRTEPIPLEDVKLMQRSGCSKVFFGLESGSNEVLRLMNKHNTIEAAEKTLDLFTTSGIETAGFFMVGYPGETHETIETTFAWALKLPLKEISFTIPFPLPGTKLFEKVCGVKDNENWHYENENRIIYQSEFDEAYLNKRIEETYVQFAHRQRSNAY